MKQLDISQLTADDFERIREALSNHYNEILAAVPGSQVYGLGSPRMRAEKNKESMIQGVIRNLKNFGQEPRHRPRVPENIRGTSIESAIWANSILGWSFESDAISFAFRVIKRGFCQDGSEPETNFETIRENMQAMIDNLPADFDKDEKITLLQLMQAKTDPWRLVRAYAVSAQYTLNILATARNQNQAAIQAVSQLLDQLDNSAAAFPVPEGGVYPDRLLRVIAGYVQEDEDVNEGMND